MKKRIIIPAAAVILAAVLACVLWLPRQPGSTGILYRITGERGTAYLLGSIHIGTPVMHPFGDVLQSAMATSDTFVFECDTDSSAVAAQLRARQALPEGESLAAVLGDALYADTASAYQSLGLSTASLDTRQPWVPINTLAVYSSAAGMGIHNVQRAISLGVETAVQAYASGHGKPFAYLETVDEVTDTMESFSDALNRYLLQDEVDVILGRTPADEAESVAQWPAWWHDGNVDAFRAFYSQSAQQEEPVLYAEYRHKLITQRNALMAARLDTMLQQGGSYFVTVGLLHLLPEEDSMLSLLTDMGYTVTLVSQPQTP